MLTTMNTAVAIDALGGLELNAEHDVIVIAFYLDHHVQRL
jgi:hypothetical protein